MEPLLRGYLEQFLENQIKEENLLPRYDYWKERYNEGIIDSIKSSMIGEIYGKMLGFVAPASIIIGQGPSFEAITELGEQADDDKPKG